MNNLGIFLGGAVNQRNTTISQGLQERALAAQEMRDQQAQRQQQFAQIQENFQGLLEQASTAMQNSGSDGGILDVVESQASILLPQLEQQAPDQARMLAAMIQAGVSGVRATPGPEQTAANAGIARGVGDVAYRDELMARGVPEAAANEAAGLTVGGGGQTFTVTTEDGRQITLTQGGAGGGAGGGIIGTQATGEFGRGTDTALNQRIVNATNTLDRARQTAAAFDARFLTIPSQLQNLASSWQERLAPESLSPEQRRDLEDFTRFRQQVYDDLIETLRELSGAAVTESEFDRLQESMPSPSDSPTQFVTKMNDRIGDIERALLRTQIWRIEGRVGIPADLMSLSSVDSWMQDRSGRMLASMRQTVPGFNDMTEAEQDELVRAGMQAMLDDLTQGVGSANAVGGANAR